MTTVALRLVAIAIAVAGIVDPALTMSGATPARLAVVSQPGSEAAAAARARLVRDLAASYEIVPRIVSDAAAAIVIGERYPAEPVPDGLLVSTVTIAQAAPPDVRLVRVEAPREVPAGTAIHVGVDVEGVGVAGKSADVSVRIRGLEVGRATHRWTEDRQRWRTGIDVVPVGDPPWVVETSVVSGQTVNTVVDIRRTPLRATFYEPRPSWAATFVRRALEADRRFEVAGVGFSSRGIAIRTGDAVPLTDSRIEATDVIIVGGLDRLSAIDVRSIERFMRERGGAVVLLPDARIAPGAARALMPDLTEQLLEAPAKLSMAAGVAPLEASELLVAQGDGFEFGRDVIARTAGANGVPVVISMPRGRGRLFVSGAMDAWRYRAANEGAFDRFWQTAIAGLALAVPPPIDLVVAPPLLRPFEQGDVTIRLRSGNHAPVTASIDGDQTIRLHPQPEAGEYRGTFVARGTPAVSTIEVRVSDPQTQAASRMVLVQEGAARIETAAGPALSVLASSHRGIDVTPDNLAELERFVRGAVVSPRADVVRHPMRSAWWLVPFVGCLSIEWWLRRRRGLR